MDSLPLVGPLRPALVSRPTRDTLLRGMLVFRWLTMVWLVSTFVYEVWDRGPNGLPIPDKVENRLEVQHPAIGFVLLGALFASLVWITWLYFSDPARILTPTTVLSEIALCALLLGLDVWVYGSPEHAQALPSVYPVASIFTVGMAAGSRAAVATGFGFGASRYVGLVFGFDGSNWSLDHVASFVLFVVTALVSAYLLERMVASDKSISTFRAREEVARTLHDGVLQTLAVIQRRSEDSELIKLARTQEHELREYLFSGDETSVDLGASLREAARKAEERYGFRVQVVVAPDLQAGTADRIHALKGAVTEALTNAHKHGKATKVTVYAEPAGQDQWEAFVSVKDDGCGFDSENASSGEGLKRSITNRVLEAGGQVEIDGRPGRGAEIKLWL